MQPVFANELANGVVVSGLEGALHGLDAELEFPGDVLERDLRRYGRRDNAGSSGHGRSRARIRWRLPSATQSPNAVRRVEAARRRLT